jgi:hypothetical protein
MMIDFKNDEDKFVWKLSTLGLFFIKSMYTDMMNDHELFFQEIYLETIKVPLKNKIFM